VSKGAASSHRRWAVVIGAGVVATSLTSVWATVQPTSLPVPGARTSSSRPCNGQPGRRGSDGRLGPEGTEPGPRVDNGSANHPPLVITLDRFGRCEVDGRSVERIFLRERLREALTERRVSTVRVSLAAGVLPEDADELLHAVQACGLDASAIETQRTESGPISPSDQQAVARFLQGQLDLQRTLWERIGQQQEHLAQTLLAPWADLRQRVSSIAEYVAPLGKHLDGLVRRMPSTKPAR